MPTDDRAVVRRPPPLAVTVFALVLGSWLVLPFVMIGTVKQDLVPYLVAGEFVGVHDDAIYVPPERFTSTDPRFHDRACELLDIGERCEGVAVPAVSPPVILPLMAALTHLSQEPAAILVRVLGAACYVAGMVLLWRDLTPRSARAGPVLAVTAVFMTAFVVDPITLGQTSPLLFLGAILVPVRWPGRVGTAACCAVWVLAAGFKGFPFLLVALALHRRWWRPLLYAGAMLATLVLATVAMLPPWIWGDYVAASRAVSHSVLEVAFNLSVQSLVHQLWPSQPPSVDLAVLVALLALLAVLWWRRIRFAPPDVEWAFLWFGTMITMPLVWSHYGIVALVPVAAAIARRRDLARWLPVLPAIALAATLVQLLRANVHVMLRDVTILTAMVPSLVFVWGVLGLTYALVPARGAGGQPSAVDGSQDGRDASKAAMSSA